MAEPIEMPFELWASVGPRNNVLHGVQSSDLSMGKVNPL